MKSSNFLVHNHKITNLKQSWVVYSIQYTIISHLHRTYSGPEIVPMEKSKRYDPWFQNAQSIVGEVKWALYCIRHELSVLQERNKEGNGPRRRKERGKDTRGWSEHFHRPSVWTRSPRTTQRKHFFCFWEGHLDHSVFLCMEGEIWGNRLNLKQGSFVSNVEKSLTREALKRRGKKD